MNPLLPGGVVLSVFSCGRSQQPTPSALRWKFLAVYTWSDSEETIRNYYGRDLKRHARTTATADRAHRSSARDARAFDATDEQYSRTGAPGAHRLGRRRRPQQRADRTKARDKPGEYATEVSFEQGITERQVSGETIRATLARLGVRWERAKRWIESPDPQYARKKGLEIG